MKTRPPSAPSSRLRSTWSRLFPGSVAFLGISLIALTASGAFAEEDEKAGEATAEPVARIKTAELRREKIAQTITAVGRVEASPAGEQTAAAPFECRVKRVLVAEGQVVEKGAPLVEIEPSPDTRLLWQSSLNAQAAARAALSNVQERFAMRLATTSDLQAAQQAAQDADLKAENLRARGLEGDLLLRAADAGAITQVDGKGGMLVAAGASLVELSSGAGRVARIGLEPSDMDKVPAGTSLTLSSATRPGTPAVAAKIASVAGRVDPDSHLVLATALLGADDGLLLGESVTAVIEVAQKEALVAPRAAALPEEDHFIVFTVNGGKAVKHDVQLGLRSGDRVEIAGGDLKEGDTVVVEGNYELTEGMKVGAGEREADVPSEPAK